MYNTVYICSTSHFKHIVIIENLQDNVDSSYIPPVTPRPSAAPKATSAPSSTSTPRSSEPPRRPTPNSSSTGYARPQTFGKDPYGARNTTNPADFQPMPVSIPANAHYSDRVIIPTLRIIVVVFTILSIVTWLLFDLPSFFMSSSTSVSGAAESVITEQIIADSIPTIPGIPDVDLSATTSAAASTVVDVVRSSWSDFFYSYSLRCAALCAVFCVFSRYGTPQLSKQYLSSIMGSESGMIFLSSLIMLAAPASFISLLPGFVQCFFPLAAYVRNTAALKNTNLPPAITALASNVEKMANHPAMKMLPRTFAEVYSLGARAELLVVAAQLPLLFTSRRSLLFLVMLVQYLPMRYIVSAYMRDAVAHAIPILDKVFLYHSLPAVVPTYYTKAKEMAWKQVDPTELEKKAQNPQSSCNIM